MEGVIWGGAVWGYGSDGAPALRWRVDRRMGSAGGAEF